MAGPTSKKNIMLSPAAADLGLGDQLQTQLEDLEAERKKKLGQVNSGDGTYGASASLGPATLALFGNNGNG